MYFYGKTDVGMRRSVNQDNFMVRAFDDMVLAAERRQCGKQYGDPLLHAGHQRP